jgi:hypothetical protein
MTPAPDRGLAAGNQGDSGMRLPRLFRASALAAAIAGLASCSDSSCNSNGPSVLDADVESTNGTMTFSSCSTPPGASLMTCNFSGPMINNGPGCASSISGSTTITASSTGQVTGTQTWTFAGTMLSGQTAVYTGFGILVPVNGTSVYHTTIQFTSVACPS